MIFKACGRCGKIHPANKSCPKYPVYNPGRDRELRSSYQWTVTSQRIRERAHFLCELCKLQGDYKPKDVEVHHIEKLTDRPDLLTDPKNLVCLCVEHHKLADAGKIDNDLLRKLAADRDAV